MYYTENIYVENTKCFRIVAKSVKCYELYTMNQYTEAGCLIGKYHTYKEAEKEVDIRLGKIKKKKKF